MKGLVIKIAVDGTVDSTEINGPPDIAVMKKAIGGGYLELVPYFTNYDHHGKIMKCIAFCDEYGKINQMPLNVPATVLWLAALQRQGRPGNTDVLVGDIAIVFGDAEFMREM